MKKGSDHRLLKSMFAVSVLTVSVSATAMDAWGSHSFKSRYQQHDRGGVIYVMDNSSEGNQINVYFRNTSGELRAVSKATIATGGLGASDNAAIDPLGSQNSLVFDQERSLLIAVNAGDNTLSVFKAKNRGLKLKRVTHVSSGGYIPVSVAVSEDRLYVLNAGGSSSIVTFSMDRHGGLKELGSLELGQSHETEVPFNNIMAPGQVGVDALNRRIIVTNAGGQQLLTAPLDDDGVPTDALTPTPTPGVVPFAFDVSRYGNILVAEAGSGSVSSFTPSAPGEPLLLSSGAVGTGQNATCWIVSTDNGFAYVANTASDTISAFTHSRTGNLTLMQDVAAEAGDAPTDMTLAGNGRYLYSLDAGSGTISGFAIDFGTGQLELVESESGLPAAAGIQGIAAYDYSK